MDSLTRALELRPPVVTDQGLWVSSDGKVVFAYLPEDADGLREIRRYEAEGNAYVLRMSATYRLAADGETWNQVGEERRHHGVHPS